jgi:hypothetical protein
VLNSAEPGIVVDQPDDDVLVEIIEPQVATTPAATFGPETVRPGDSRFPSLVTAFNRRFSAESATVELVGTTEQVRCAVQAALDAGKHISIRGGGHCYSDFVYNNAVSSVLDLSMMNKVYFDRDRNAFAVEGGAVLGDVYPVLFRGYGVTLPGGHCPGTGIGGHATGGGHGMLTRQFGLITDHIHAVEMVVVDDHRRARVVHAERGGPNDDLWWAISGGGGGNFGVITKYWFRSPSAHGTDPGRLLPRPPTDWLVANVTIPWSELNQQTFTALVNNMGIFYQNNSAPDSPFNVLSSILSIPHTSSGPITVITLVDASETHTGHAPDLLASFHQALFAGTGISADVPFRKLPWLAVEETINTATPLIETNATLRNAVKSANLVQGFTPDQIASIYKNMTRTDYANAFPALLQLGSLTGGVTNAVPEDATAISYRDTNLLAFFQVYWADADGDAENIAWLRQIYQQVFVSTGGVPVPGDAYQGCVINLPDPDTTDPTMNTSGVPWQTLYYGGNYPRLQRVKAKWDPTNFFRHPMSITAV